MNDPPVHPGGGSIRLLVVDDNALDAELELAALRRAALPVEAHVVSTEPDFRRVLDTFEPDVILCDFTFPQFDGVSALRIAAEAHPLVPVIFVTGTLDEERIAIVVQNGAADYVLKSNLTRLPGAVRRAAERGAKLRQLRAAEARVARLSALRDFISAINGTIVRRYERAALFGEACRIATAIGGFLFAAIVTRRDPASRFALDAFAGPAVLVPPMEQWLQNLSPEPDPRDGGLPEAVRTKTAVVFNDLSVDLSVARRREMWERGTRSVGTFPLVVGGEAVGGFIVGSAVIDFFNAEEIALLGDVANNLSFALDFLLERERSARLNRIRDVLSSVNAAVVRLHDGAQLRQEACRIAVGLGGFTNAMVVELDLESRRLELPAFLGRSDPGAVVAALRRTLADEAREPGLIETSIRSLRPAVKNDLSDEFPGRDWLAADGILAAGSFPLVIDGRCSEAMVFETDTGAYFDAEEVELLTNLTNNLAFGLNLLDKAGRIDYLAYYDALTDLPNRTFFFARMADDIVAGRKAGKSVALAIVDVSGFSDLNNTLGEHVGDDALRIVAARLRESIGTGHLARVGGDTFALCFPMSDSVLPLTEMLSPNGGLRMFREPLVLGERTLHLSARAGCAVFPTDGETAQQLFRSAETALASAKASRTSCRFYARELDARLARKLDLEARLHRALDQEQFELYYQPKIDARSRALSGFEALLRWRDPQRGIVGPGEFIPVLEQTGMIVAVGRWALDEAVRQFAAWHAAGLRPPRIAVNLSAVQLRRGNLPGEIRSALAGCAENCPLDLEITESMLMENVESTVEQLTVIRALGPKISLDDFGTGYSSLSYIQRLPLNALKIDRSFISGMVQDANKATIVSTIISLGKALRLTVIAEGVETEEEVALLTTLRCDQFQGFLFGRPVAADEAASRFLTGRN